MPKLFLRVCEGSRPHLIASDRASEEYLAKQTPGTIIRCEARKPRHPGHHAKFFAMLKLVWEGTELQDRYPCMDNLLDAFKYEMGYVETFKAVDGTILTKPKSIAFESMAQDEFQDFYDRAVEIIATRLVPHLDKKDLERQLEDMIS